MLAGLWRRQHQLRSHWTLPERQTMLAIKGEPDAAGSAAGAAILAGSQTVLAKNGWRSAQAQLKSQGSLPGARRSCSPFSRESSMPGSCKPPLVSWNCRQCSP